MDNNETILFVYTNSLKICKNNGVKRFIYASSSSVYGIKSEENVSENAQLAGLNKSDDAAEAEFTTALAQEISLFMHAFDEKWTILTQLKHF